MKHFYLLIILFCFCQQAKAQDPRFAQFYAAPDQLNPALNVVYEGQVRFIANYRNQWSSVLNEVPFKTVAAHFDYRLNVGSNDYLSIGFNGLQDQAGTAHLKRVKGHINAAFMKYLGGGRKKSYFLVAGLQAGMGQQSLDWEGLWFSEQYDVIKESINFNADSGEVESRTGTVYPDFSAGLMWYTVSAENSFYIGGALYHINSPNFSFFDGNVDRLHQRYVAHLGGEIAMNNNLSILPAASIFLQGAATDVNIGTNFRHTSGEANDLALRIGAWAHVAGKEDKGVSLEAVTITTMLEMKTWTLGLSYDVNISQLTPASNARGAFEASFTYIVPEKKRRRAKLKCPKF